MALPSATYPTESQEQQALVKWLTARGVLFFSVPNEAKRNYKAASRLKSMGMRSGVPDLVVCSQPHEDACVDLPIFLELKRAKPRGKLSANQKWWITALRAEGYPCFVCYGAQQAIDVLKGFGY